MRVRARPLALFVTPQSVVNSQSVGKKFRRVNFSATDGQ